ncbi:MAG: nucleoside monophosphate kinase [Lentisphaeria bacterium]|nr:nucleoside monophosphate kinase [Lentisphaeria bacterium]
MSAKKSAVELKNAQQIFQSSWQYLEGKYGREKLRFPKEIMWLGGAPGAGKGTNTPFILRERGITAEPVVMSSLLKSPHAESLKSAGHLVDDKEVVQILLEELLQPQYKTGVVVDGFPRTSAQVECVKMLYNKMMELRAEFFNTPIGPQFRRPIFRITILHVREDVSIDRQLYRGRQIQANNEKVKATGEGHLMELRETDLDVNLAKRRYVTFSEETLRALESLREYFHYHFIDANGPVEDVEKKIIEGFQYESSLELGHDTYDSIRNIMTAAQLSRHPRQELVKRLDNHRHRHAELFAHVVGLIEQNFIPVLQMHAAVGVAVIKVSDAGLSNRLAVQMLLDILTERGYFPSFYEEEEYVPLRIDAQTNAIINATQKKWIFKVKFPVNRIRRGGH